MKKEQFITAGRSCIAYCYEKPHFLLIQPVGDNDLASLDEEVHIIEANVDKTFALIAFKVNSWNEELSPWDAPAVFGKEGFGHGAKDTLTFVTDFLIPEAKARLEIDEDIPIIIGGYSLAALFALWSVYQTSCFSAVAAASPSVWFPVWNDYAMSLDIRCDCVYLSLGDKEEKAKNKVMAEVGNCMREYYDFLKNISKVKGCILEWNEGNHFRDVSVRTAKGFVWCMGEI